MTYREILLFGERQLFKAGIADAKNDAWLLLAMACRIDKNYYYLHSEEEAATEQELEFGLLVKKRSERIPLQYITGEQEFMGLDFQVNSNVLIPRQDTEVLVEEALKVLTSGMEVLDMCTGSGCIAISIAKLKPGVKVTAGDISQGAVNVAKENARKHETAVVFLTSDMFGQIKGQFDVIVSNPPYIPTGVIPKLMPEVRDFEPHLALDGSEDGLMFYKILAGQGRDYLKPGGYLMMEIGCDQAKAVTALLKQYGYREIKVVKDLAGLDRVVIGKEETYV